MAKTPNDPNLDRYSRQILLDRIGAAGQRQLLASRVVLIGCGALGSALAETLVRAGVGWLRIVDRDTIELNNLQRQVLFDEDDIAANLPKAEAARRKLTRINSDVHVEARVADANARTIEALVGGANLILDGTDNLQTRFLVNDIAVKSGVPWIYGACIGTEGMIMPVLPHHTPCLRCVFGQAPAPGTTPTCDTVGILGPVSRVVASLQAVEAIRILTGHPEAGRTGLVTLDVWDMAMRKVDVAAARDADCPCCGQGRYEYLDGTLSGATADLCGRDAIQVDPPQGCRVDLAELARRLASVAEVAAGEFMVRATVEGYVITVFSDGRAIVKGTTDPARARALVDRYVGA